MDHREPVDPKKTAEEFLQRSLRILEWNHGFFETLKADPDLTKDPAAPVKVFGYQKA
jgi:hypothetical protein